MSCPRSNLTGTHREIDSTKVNTSLANLKDDCVFARRLFLDDRLGHKSVSMTAGDKIDSINLSRNLRITNLSSFRNFVITKMRHAENKAAAFFFFQILNYAPCSLNRIEISNAFE